MDGPRGFAPSAPRGRLVSLDVFRGLTIAGMILVTDPGTYSAVYAPLRHAEWDGATATDMIFPSFLFIVGMSITLSLTARIEAGASSRALVARAVRRAVLLIALGLAVNGFPHYDWQHLRLPGILQRIAVCYLGSALIWIAAMRRSGIAALRGSKGELPDRGAGTMRIGLIGGLAVVLLAGYWLLLKTIPVPGIGAGHLDSYGNLPAYVDRAVFGVDHLWAYGTTPGRGVTYDSEGILSTIPALATTLLGVLAGEWMRGERGMPRKVLGMVFAGLALIALCWLLSPYLVINKRIWTTTFALLSGGVSLCLFAFFYVVVDGVRSRGWALPGVIWLPGMIFGTNAILAFTVSSVLTSLLQTVHVSGTGSLDLHHWGYQHLFLPWLAPIHASLAYALAIVVLNLLLIYPLYRKRIFLRL